MKLYVVRASDWGQFKEVPRMMNTDRDESIRAIRAALDAGPAARSARPTSAKRKETRP